MKSYWSCSKFANWLRGTPKIESGTVEEWNAWEKVAKKKKVRYWLAEEGLDYLENFVYWPSNRIRDLCFYINNRFVSKTHALTSTLKRGQWHEFETRLLYSAFDELVNFVEEETAWHHVVCSEEERKKYRPPWYRSIFCMRLWRCPEAGLAHLEWASGLKHEEDWVDKDDPKFGQPTHQALAAREIILLYKWWKEVRPQRPDPTDASGWSDFCEEMRKKAIARGDNPVWAGLCTHESDVDQERSHKILEISHKMEQEQLDEDTEMLIRLVKIRQSLWI